MRALIYLHLKHLKICPITKYPQFITRPDVTSTLFSARQPITVGCGARQLEVIGWDTDPALHLRCPKRHLGHLRPRARRASRALQLITSSCRSGFPSKMSSPSVSEYERTCLLTFKTLKILPLYQFSTIYHNPKSTINIQYLAFLTLPAV